MNALFFKHDLGARNDPKLLRLAMKHGMEGIGAYWCLVEMMYEQGGAIPVDDIDSIAYSLRVDVSIIKDIIEIGLFTIEDDHLTKDRITGSITEMSEAKERRTKAAKIAADARWKNHNANAMRNACESDANAMRSQCDFMPREDIDKKEDIDNIKEKNIKEKEKAKPASRFVPPSISQVSDYISEMGYQVDPVRFIAYYESNGWMVGRNKMKSWKAAVTNWDRMDNERRTSNNGKRTDTEGNTGRGGNGSPESDYPTSL